jgi:excisionase family DNA binding protein
MSNTDLYTVQEAMDMLGGISRNTIYKLMREGLLASVPIGRRRFIQGRAIEDFVAAATTTQSPSVTGHGIQRTRQIPLGLDIRRDRNR